MPGVIGYGISLLDICGTLNNRQQLNWPNVGRSQVVEGYQDGGGRWIRTFSLLFGPLLFRNCKCFLHRCLAFRQREEPVFPSSYSERDLEPYIHFSTCGFATPLCHPSETSNCCVQCGIVVGGARSRQRETCISSVRQHSVIRASCVGRSADTGRHIRTNQPSISALAGCSHPGST
jgi:hypothetical protein